MYILCNILFPSESIMGKKCFLKWQELHYYFLLAQIFSFSFLLATKSSKEWINQLIFDFILGWFQSIPNLLLFRTSWTNSCIPDTSDLNRAILLLHHDALHIGLKSKRSGPKLVGYYFNFFFLMDDLRKIMIKILKKYLYIVPFFPFVAHCGTIPFTSILSWIMSFSTTRRKVTTRSAFIFVFSPSHHCND